jgi:flagellar motility protein MotE (MotC chaperone)
MRQKITDLETCNQEHLRELQKANAELSQSNMNMKCDYEHKMGSLMTELDLAQNKIKELQEELRGWETRFGKEAKAWLEEKGGLERKYAGSEETWKNNYEDMAKQKDKAVQELSRKTYEMGEKEK